MDLSTLIHNIQENRKTFLDIFHNIHQKKYQHYSKEQFDKFAAYVMGKHNVSQKLTKKKITILSSKIDDVIRNYENNLKHLKNNYENRAQRFMLMWQELSQREIDLSDEIKLNTMLIDYYQIAGCLISYLPFIEDDTVPGPHKDLPNYKVHKIITNTDGLKLTVLIPEKQIDSILLPPIVCCRGTTENRKNLLDDLNPNIGEYSFNQSRDKIKETLIQAVETSGGIPAVIAGHSLGGAVAQHITAAFPRNIVSSTNTLNKTIIEITQLIKETHLFSSPGTKIAETKTVLSDSSFKKELHAHGFYLEEEINENKHEETLIEHPPVFSYIHAADPISLVGGKIYNLTSKQVIGSFDWNQFVNSPLKTILRAHSWDKFLSEQKDATASANQWSTTRKSLSLVIECIRLFVRMVFGSFIFSYLLDFERTRKAGHETLAFLNGVDMEDAEVGEFVPENYHREVVTSCWEKMDFAILSEQQNITGFRSRNEMSEHYNDLNNIIIENTKIDGVKKINRSKVYSPNQENKSED